MQLMGLSLPQDAEKIQNVVSVFLSSLFENDGEFRQNLTESEDYILQSALQLLQAQQNIAIELAKSSNTMVLQSNANTPNTVIDEPIRMAAAGGGAFLGGGLGLLSTKLFSTTSVVTGGIVSTCGAIAGAVAGTALLVYYLTKNKCESNENWMSEKQSVAATINSSVFSSIVGKICESIDGVISTYRIQIKRIANVYEMKEKPSLLNEYSALMEQVANVCNIAKTGSVEVPKKLATAIGLLEECLENYDLKFENGKIINC